MWYLQKWVLNWFKILRLIRKKRNDALHPLYRLGDVATTPAQAAGRTRGARALLSQGWLKIKVVLVLGLTALVVIYHASPKYWYLANIYLLYFASFSMKSCVWIYCPKVSYFGSLVLGRYRSALLRITMHFHPLRTILCNTANNTMTLLLGLAHLPHKTWAKEQSGCWSIDLNYLLSLLQ